MKDTLANKKDLEQLEPLQPSELEQVFGGGTPSGGDLTHEYDQDPYNERKKKKAKKTP